MGIGITHSDEYINDHRKLEFKVDIENDSVKDQIPKRVNDIRVNFVDAPENRRGGAAAPSDEGRTTAESQTGYCSDNDYSDIPGGVRTETSDGYHGTSCCKVKDDSGTYYLLHCYHLFDSGTCDEYVGGQRAIQGSDDFGYVSEWYDRHDWAGIEVDNSSVSLDNTIRRPSGREEVLGYVTRSALASWSSYDPVYKMGIKTGETVSYTPDYSYSGGWACHDWDGYGVRVGNKFADGDSGGPVFADWGGPYLMSIASQHWGSSAGTVCGADASEGVIGWPAYKLANNAGFEFYLG